MAIKNRETIIIKPKPRPRPSTNDSEKTPSKTKAKSKDKNKNKRKHKNETKGKTQADKIARMVQPEGFCSLEICANCSCARYY
ncbi:hypothetical protein KVR01_009329 [Diaporthe batatas]|uniref:uncharacterized protein n=1 Tax=Diaporthe batatas TaxID=748121 RepID=UPI001D04F524|nr:uncharacterized protein KVR01_009329 [Diaporthe batatas]KAG8161065.1 hypothetical protein KVR01_009329 [Diaporthe batatas]